MPVTYTGPIPPTPTATSTDEAWRNWWSYQTHLTNIRYENEREAHRAKTAVDEAALVARQAVLDAQHAEKMAAEAKCAESNRLLATAQSALAVSQAAMSEAIKEPQQSALPTKAQLVFHMLVEQPQATIFTNTQLVSGAAGIVDAYVARYPDAVRA